MTEEEFDAYADSVPRPSRLGANRYGDWVKDSIWEFDRRQATEVATPAS